MPKKRLCQIEAMMFTLYLSLKQVRKDEEAKLLKEIELKNIRKTKLVLIKFDKSD